MGNQGLVLCMDGGGVRGLVIITMLRFIERILNCEIKDFFTFYGGTSTGGILALAFHLNKEQLKSIMYEKMKIKEKSLGKFKRFKRLFV